MPFLDSVQYHTHTVLVTFLNLPTTCSLLPCMLVPNVEHLDPNLTPHALVVNGCPLDKSFSCHRAFLQDSNLSRGQYFPAFEHSCLDATLSQILMRASGFKSYSSRTWICIWWSPIWLW